ncbi:hypothetical protein L195_g025121, partial [Trifolium pratense]
MVVDEGGKFEEVVVWEAPREGLQEGVQEGSREEQERSWTKHVDPKTRGGSKCKG